MAESYSPREGVSYVWHQPPVTSGFPTAFYICEPGVRFDPCGGLGGSVKGADRARLLTRLIVVVADEAVPSPCS
jgi:hypothetical protein